MCISFTNFFQFGWSEMKMADVELRLKLAFHMRGQPAFLPVNDFQWISSGLVLLWPQQFWAIGLGAIFAAAAGGICGGLPKFRHSPPGELKVPTLGYKCCLLYNIVTHAFVTEYWGPDAHVSVVTSSCKPTPFNTLRPSFNSYNMLYSHLSDLTRWSKF